MREIHTSSLLDADALGHPGVVGTGGWGVWLTAARCATEGDHVFMYIHELSRKERVALKPGPEVTLGWRWR